MSPRAIFGLLLVLAALVGLAAVLPGGQVDYNEFTGKAPPVSKLPSAKPPDLSDAQKKLLENLIDKALDGDLSDEELKQLLDALKDAELSPEQLRDLAKAMADQKLSEEQLERLGELLRGGGMSPEEIEDLLDSAKDGQLSQEETDALEDAFQRGLLDESRTDQLLDDAATDGLSDEEFDELLESFEDGAPSDEHAEELMRLAGNGDLTPEQLEELFASLEAGGMSRERAALLMAAAAAGGLSSAERDEVDSALERSGALGDQEGIPTHIEITRFPTGIRRGEPFALGGDVGSAEGPLPSGIPITIFFNRTKEATGTAFCQTVSDDDSGFDTTCTLPDSAPVDDLQLVARLGPGTLSGRPTLPSYSDPQIRVQSTSVLTITGPPKGVLGSPTDYAIRLVDDSGGPVAGRTVTAKFDDEAPQTLVTDASGTAAAPNVWETAGPHSITATFSGDDHFGASEDTLAIESTNLNVQVSAQHDAVPARRVTVTGTIRDDVGGVPALAVSATLRSTTQSVTTDEAGSFRVELATQLGPGLHFVTILIPTYGASTQVSLLLEASTGIDAVVPTHWHAPSALTIPLTLQNASEAAASPPAIRVSLDGSPLTNVSLDEDGTGTLRIPSPPATGAHTLTFDFPGTTGLKAAQRVATIRFGNATLTHTSADAVHAPGATWAPEATLRFDGQPLDKTRLEARVATANGTGVTGTDGKATLEVALPTTLPIGAVDATLRAPDIGFQQSTSLQIGRPSTLDLGLSAYQFRFGGASFRPVALTQDGATITEPINVTIDGEPASADGAGPDYDLPGPGFLMSRTRVDAHYAGAGELAAASAAVTVTAINPLVPIVVLLGAVGGVAAIVVRGRRAALVPAPAFEEGAATAAPTGPVELVSPTISPHAPAVFDPAYDPALVFRFPGTNQANPPANWENQASARTEATPQGLRVDLADVPNGDHVLYFGTAGTPDHAQYPLRIAPFHQVVDESFHGFTRSLVGVDRTTDQAARMAEVQRVLREVHDVPELVVREFRRVAQAALYAGDACDRETFEAYYETFHRVTAALTKTQGEPA